MPSAAIAFTTVSTRCGGQLLQAARRFVRGSQPKREQLAVAKATGNEWQTTIADARVRPEFQNEGHSKRKAILTNQMRPHAPRSGRASRGCPAGSQEEPMCRRFQLCMPVEILQHIFAERPNLEPRHISPDPDRADRARRRTGPRVRHDALGLGAIVAKDLEVGARTDRGTGKTAAILPHIRTAEWVVQLSAPRIRARSASKGGNGEGDEKVGGELVVAGGHPANAVRAAGCRLYP